MTKAAMIQEIQRQEAKLFLELKEATARYGEDDAYTKKQRSAYVAIYDLTKALGIKMDVTLPDNVKALELIRQINQVA